MLISLTDLIKKTIDLYKKNYRVFVIYSTMIMLPIFIVRFVYDSLVVFFNINAFLFTNIVYNIIFTCLFILAYIFTIWFSITYIKVIHKHYRETQKNEQSSADVIKSEMKETKHLIPTVVFVTIISSLAVLAGLLFLLIPGLILIILFAFSTYAVIFENKKGTDALKYSMEIVKGRFWATVLRLLAPVILYSIIYAILQWPFTHMGQGTIVSIVGSIIVLILEILFTPLHVVNQVILFDELNKTKLAVPATTPNTGKQDEPPF